MSAALHPAAAQGFEAGAAVYDHARPDYPPALVGWLEARVRLGPGKRALDLGAGGGKLIPRLLETGAEVIAVEPVAAMRETLQRRFPQVTALEGTADAIPLADASVDAVVCGQSFHWFATAEALAEIRRVLRPGGALGLVWNVRLDDAPWAQAVQAVVRRHERDAPRREPSHWRGVFPAEGFGPLEEARLDHAQSGDPETLVVQRALSTSFIAALPPEEREAVAAELRAIAAAAPELDGRTTVTLPYETRLYAADAI